MLTPPPAAGRWSRESDAILSEEDPCRIAFDLSKKVLEGAPLLETVVGMPPPVSIRPKESPAPSPRVVSELCDNVLNLPAPILKMGAPFQKLDVGPNEPKIMRQLVPNLERHFVAEATKRARCSLLFQFRYRHDSNLAVRLTTRRSPAGTEHQRGPRGVQRLGWAALLLEYLSCALVTATGSLGQPKPRSR